jgi:hypothetical protein
VGPLSSIVRETLNRTPSRVFPTIFTIEYLPPQDLLFGHQNLGTENRFAEYQMKNSSVSNGPDFAWLAKSVLLLAAIAGCSTDSGVMTRREAGKLFSATLHKWRDDTLLARKHSANALNMCRDNSLAPISWRFALVEGSGGMDRPEPDFRAGWNADSNSWWRSEETGKRGVYSFYKSQDPRINPPFTKIMAIRGDDTAFDAPFDGVNVLKLERDAIVICEVRNSRVHWMQPGDLEIGKIPRTINPKSELGIGGESSDCFLVGFADGAVWCLKASVPFESLEKFFTLADAAKYDREEELGKYVVDRLEPFEEWCCGEDKPYLTDYSNVSHLKNLISLQVHR